MWWGPGGDTVNNDNILTSVMTEGEYTCMACVDVPQVNISNLCANSTVNIQTTSELLAPIVSVNGPPIELVLCCCIDGPLSYAASPQPVSGVVCSNPSPSTLIVSWLPPTGPVLSYQVEVKQYSLVGGTVNTISLSTPFDRENIINTTTVEGLGEY